ncbi:hypothetical protein RND81_05G060500 [Saponaria officinalis]|uniref:CRIB domain-containing protein n=1 Tax=Saponaria officinalis TaxID=3572 RepID=A0AAW1KR32_SAPOF
MSNKMKGVLKGLRYISQIFEDGEEPEMQIGFPTDVKHVAHIGWDGPAANAPSWIQNFKEGEPGAPSLNGDQQNVTKTRDSGLPGQERRCSTGSDLILESPSRRRSDKGKGARRHSSAGPSSADSPSRDTSSSSKTTRRRKTKTGSRSKPTSTTPDLVYSDSGVASTTARSAGNGLKSENDQILLDDNARQIHAM